MVRTYKRKRAQTTNPETLQHALNHFINSSDGYRKTAHLFKIPASTLHGYINKYKCLPASEKSTSHMLFGYQKPRQVFTDDQEATFVSYLKHASSIYFGLSPREVRTLAYESEKRFNLSFPPSWSDVQMAGPDWFSAFLKRHPGLSIRTPESTSIARATAFNKINVDQFFGKLAEVMDRYKFDATRIWNVDETGITTVAKPNKVIACTGVKQVGSLTSAERGQLVTLCAAVSAAGQAIPPFLIYPRVHFKQHFLHGAPPGTAGSAYPSGWMTADNFLLFLKHFAKHVKPTTDNPILILLDNHESHLAIEALDYAKENGIIMLSFPPHCSHRLQPLDFTVFGPLKKKISQSQSNWLRSNPGKPITIYELATIMCGPWQEALTMANICSGFQKSGIFPFNNEIFSDNDFMPSEVTDRPYEEPSTAAKDQCHQEGPILSAVESVDDTSAILNRYLEQHNISVIPVRGDGHCLLYAVCSSLSATGQGTHEDEEMGDILSNEISQHREFYKDFVVTEDMELSAAVQAFLGEKQYNNNCCDVFLNALCNAMRMKVFLIRMKEGTISQIEVVPGRPGAEIQKNIHLILYGSGVEAHYCGAVCQTNSEVVQESMFPQHEELCHETAGSIPPHIPDAMSPQHKNPFMNQLGAYRLTHLLLGNLRALQHSHLRL